MITKVIYRVSKTPLGFVLLTSSEDALLSLQFVDDAKTVAKESCPILDSVEDELSRYFGGALKQFKTPIALAGTEFQKQVWQELLCIPYGKTVSYAELARSIGRPTAFRAAAGANGANPLPIIVPCHRVINGDGGLGGYSGGTQQKRALLRLEGLKL